MKKNILIVMTILLITGCGKKVDLTKIKDEMSKKDNYQTDINVKGYGIKQDITIKKINDKNHEIIVNDLNRYTFKDDKIYKNDKETNEEVKYNDYEKYLNIFNYFSLAVEALASIIFCLICNGESQFNDCIGILLERFK